MSGVVVTFVAILGVWAVWRGFRRGALSTFLGWLPTLGAVLILVSAIRAAWSHPAYFDFVCVSGGIAALGLFIAGTLAVRRRLRVLKERRLAASAEESRSIRRTADRFGGAALGIIHAALICLGIACIGSALSFTVSLGGERGERAGQSPSWAAAFRRACGQAADIANFGVLQYIPGIRESSREFRALIVVLNAPKEKLRLVADKHGIARLRHIPVIRKAASDDEYMALITDIAEGNRAGLRRLAKSPITRELLDCPEVRELASKLKPSQLAADIEAINDDEGDDNAEGRGTCTAGAQEDVINTFERSSAAPQSPNNK